MAQQTVSQSTVAGELDKTKYGLPIDRSFAVAASEDRVQRAAESLTRNGFLVHVVDTPKDARSLVESLLPLDKSVFTASSQTLKLSGLDEAINGPGTKFRSVRREIAKLDRPTQFREQVKMGAAPDVVVGSVHAITESGQVLTASGSGSQLATYAAGAELVIWVVGAQKLVRDFDEGMRRVEQYSYPLEDARLHETIGRPSSVAKILIVNRELFPGRTTIVIVREAIGF